MPTHQLLALAARGSNRRIMQTEIAKTAWGVIIFYLFSLIVFCLSAYSYSTYLGGSRRDRINDLAVDNNGNIYVIGTTWSADFPVKNAHQVNLSGDASGRHQDAFVAKLSADGTLVYST